MSAENVAQETATHAIRAAASAYANEQPPQNSNLLSPLNDARTAFANLTDEEASLMRFLRGMAEDYEFFGLGEEADYIETVMAEIVETSKGRRNSFLSTLLGKRIDVNYGPSAPPPQPRSWRNKQPQQQGMP